MLKLEAAKPAAATQSELVQTLQSRIDELEAAAISSKESIELLEKNNAAAISEAASVEHEALLKAQADFKAISEEVEALRSTHSQALQDSGTQIEQLRAKVAETEVLAAQLASLKAEKEENANKLSELEIEVLELKETQEELEDGRDKLQQKILLLEEQLAEVTTAGTVAAEEAITKDKQHAEQLASLAQEHQKVLEENSARQAELNTALESLKNQLSDVSAAKEQAEKDLLDKENIHAGKLEELEHTYANQRVALEADIKRISKELQVRFAYPF